MSAIFEMPIADETLSSDELHRITGHAYSAGQAKWLTEAGWIFHTNRAGDPIVGRLFARMKMAGIHTPSLTSPTGWAPDFRGLR